MNKPGILLFALVAASCISQKEYTSPQGYDLSKPVTYKMPAILEEISGISFHQGSDTVYAIQDEDGLVFHFKPGDKAQKTTKFGKKGDYEDVAVCNGRIIVLRSDGSLFAFPQQETALSQAVNVKEWKKIVPAGEYESLYADPATNEITVLCKQCEVDKKTSHVSGYVLQWNNDELVIKNSFLLDASALQKKFPKNKSVFKPSAITINPQTGQWFILSSVNKLLVVADRNWKIIEAHSLNPSLFPQPEGIAFDEKGNLFISNEKNLAPYGTLLKFEHKQH